MHGFTNGSVPRVKLCWIDTSIGTLLVTDGIVVFRIQHEKESAQSDPSTGEGMKCGLVYSFDHNHTDHIAQTNR